MQQGFFYDFSNYGIHDRLSDDGLTQWHPAFLALGKTLEECAAKYRGFCKKYRTQPKPESKNHWGSRLLAGLVVRGKPKKSSPGQMALPWAQWEAPDSEVQAVAEKFVFANCYNQQAAGVMLSHGIIERSQPVILVNANH
jgi:putative transposase